MVTISHGCITKVIMTCKIPFYDDLLVIVNLHTKTNASMIFHLGEGNNFKDLLKSCKDTSSSLDL